MMTKTAYYMQMAQEAAAQITGSKEQWTAFLTTSARLYKYPFAEQLMIYKQRPEATVEPVNKSGHEKYYFLNLIFKSRH